MTPSHTHTLARAKVWEVIAYPATKLWNLGHIFWKIFSRFIGLIIGAPPILYHEISWWERNPSLYYDIWGIKVSLNSHTFALSFIWSFPCNSITHKWSNKTLTKKQATWKVFNGPWPSLKKYVVPWSYGPRIYLRKFEAMHDVHLGVAKIVFLFMISILQRKNSINNVLKQTIELYSFLLGL